MLLYITWEDQKYTSKAGKYFMVNGIIEIFAIGEKNYVTFSSCVPWFVIEQWECVMGKAACFILSWYSCCLWTILCWWPQIQYILWILCVMKHFSSAKHRHIFLGLLFSPEKLLHVFNEMPCEFLKEVIFLIIVMNGL